MKLKPLRPQKSDAELVITRTLDAPRELVFEVFTQSEHLLQWWGPQGYEMNVSRFEPQPEGVFLYSQKPPEGQLMWGKFVYEEIAKPERLVYRNSFSDAEGRTIRAPFNVNWPLEIRNVYTFEDKDGKTFMTLRGVPIDPTKKERKTFEAAIEMVKGGFAGTLSQLEEYLSKLAK
jgi:Uncharacterized conserved protein